MEQENQSVSLKNLINALKQVVKVDHDWNVVEINPMPVDKFKPKIVWAL